MTQAIQHAPASAAVDTKAASRRSLRFQSLQEVLGDLQAIEASIDAGTLEHTGNWQPGEIFDHLRKFLQGAIDGFPDKAPAPIRWIARMMLKKRATESDEPFPAGFKLPKQASALLPEPDIDARRALGELRTQIERVVAGEKMNQPSPLIGSLQHEEWMVMQLKHFSLHLSFLHPGGPHPDGRPVG